jgi:hypothetical protein
VADTKFSALTAVATPAATDEFGCNQGGTSKKQTRAQIHALESGEHLVLPQVGEPATPTLAFGNGNTGFYEESDDTIGISCGGAIRWRADATWFAGSPSDGAALVRSGVSATVPSLLPDKGDPNTGIGTAAADQLSLIAGGFELLRLADTAPNATLTATVDAASTEVLKIVGPDRATPADDDEIYISFNLEDSAANDEFARITAVAEDVTTTEEDGALKFAVNVAGTLTEAMRLESDVVSGGAADHTQIILPQHNDGATPTLAFGDGDCGFYESVDDRIALSFGETAGVCHFFNSGLRSLASSTGAAIIFSGTAATTPTFLPRANDADTGIGSAGSDQLSLIAGGTEALRITEGASTSICTFDFDAGDNAAPQVGSLTSLKSVSTTVAAATAATLTASNLIPAGSFVLGITLRVETTFDNTSSLTTFSVGDGSDADRWGTAIARTAGTTVDLTDATASPGGWFILAVVATSSSTTWTLRRLQDNGTIPSYR